MQGFLFGKLPAFGDFVSRGLSPTMRSWWDEWCSAEIMAAQASFGDDFERRYLATAPRRFLINPRVVGEPWQAGCLVRSFDRAGRAFPFVLGVGSSVPIDRADGAGLGERLAACVESAFAPGVDLDALIIAAERAASDTAGPVRSVQAIAARQSGWIGDTAFSVEVS